MMSNRRFQTDLALVLFGYANDKTEVRAPKAYGSDLDLLPKFRLEQTPKALAFKVSSSTEVK